MSKCIYHNWRCDWRHFTSWGPSRLFSSSKSVLWADRGRPNSCYPKVRSFAQIWINWDFSKQTSCPARRVFRRLSRVVGQSWNNSDPPNVRFIVYFTRPSARARHYRGYFIKETLARPAWKTIHGDLTDKSRRSKHTFSSKPRADEGRWRSVRSIDRSNRQIRRSSLFLESCDAAANIIGQCLVLSSHS